jgi:hypothetical protein
MKRKSVQIPWIATHILFSPCLVSSFPEESFASPWDNASYQKREGGLRYLGWQHTVLSGLYPIFSARESPTIQLQIGYYVIYRICVVGNYFQF